MIGDAVYLFLNMLSSLPRNDWMKHSFRFYLEVHLQIWSIAK